MAIFCGKGTTFLKRDLWLRAIKSGASCAIVAAIALTSGSATALPIGGRSMLARELDAAQMRLADSVSHRHWRRSSRSHRLYRRGGPRTTIITPYAPYTYPYTYPYPYSCGYGSYPSRMRESGASKRGG